MKLSKCTAELSIAWFQKNNIHTHPMEDYWKSWGEGSLSCQTRGMRGFKSKQNKKNFHGGEGGGVDITLPFLEEHIVKKWVPQRNLAFAASYDIKKLSNVDHGKNTSTLCNIAKGWGQPNKVLWLIITYLACASACININSHFLDSVLWSLARFSCIEESNNSLNKINRWNR